MKKICMIVYSYYPEDPRVRREAEALAKNGYGVDVICLKNAAQAKSDRINNVNVYRLSIERMRKGKLLYIRQYFIFIVKSFFKVLTLHFRNKYSIVHIHNMPDVLVFSALVPRICRAKVILDLHDPMPEMYMTKYHLSSDHIAINFLRLLEKWSIAFAHVVLTPNIAFQKLFISRSCNQDKIHIIMNSPQESIFGNLGDSPGYFDGSDPKVFRIMYHGIMAERSGLALALHAIHSLRSTIPGIVLDVFGEGDFVEEFLRIRKLLNLEKVINYHGYIALEKIARAIQDIDVGLIPNLRSPFTQINLPTRIFEYLSLNKPVIAPRTAGIQDYFEDDSIFYFEPGQQGSLENTLAAVYAKPLAREAVLHKGRKVYEEHCWKIEATKLVDIVGKLAN